jgi:hypothetical protein
MKSIIFYCLYCFYGQNHRQGCSALSIPDIIVYGDDIASSTGLFFARKFIEKIIWPHESKLHHAAVAKGVIAEIMSAAS